MYSPGQKHLKANIKTTKCNVKIIKTNLQETDEILVAIDRNLSKPSMRLFKI